MCVITEKFLTITFNIKKNKSRYCMYNNEKVLSYNISLNL